MTTRRGSRDQSHQGDTGQAGGLVHVGLGLSMGAMQLLTRLRDHIERLDGGHPYAADDLAVVLRALMHPGSRNDVLRRLYSFVDSHADPGHHGVETSGRQAIGVL